MRLTVDRSALSPRTEALLTAWGYVQHELLFLSWAIMDAALLTPLALGIMRFARYWQPGLVLLWLLILMLFAFYLARLLSAIQLPPQHQQTVMALTLFLVVVVTLPTFFHEGSAIFRFGWVSELLTAINEENNNLWLRDVLVFGLIVLAWARGLQLVRREYTIGRAGLRLRVGGLIIAPLVIWLASVRLLWDSSPYILLFFLAGLTAVAIIRAEEIEQEQNGESVALDPRWLTAVLLASLLTIFTAGTLAVLISGESANRVITFMEPVWNGLRLTGAVALTTLLFLLLPVLELVDVLSNFLNELFAVLSPWLVERWATFGKILGKFFINARVPLLLPDENSVANPLETRFIFDEIEGLGFQLSRNVQIIIVLLAVALILLVALLVSRLYRQTAMATRVSGRTILHGGDDDDEGNLLQRLLGRLGLLRDWQTAVSIRRIYRKMLRAADASGYPRLEAETPYEFLKTLAQAWPHNRPETQLITSAYVKVRYGELPETPQELQAIKDAWQTLEQTRPIEKIDG
ncbi:MAG: DUF4129 domain-containing protein [Anaerolineaceae bacterium]|nr:DUF4129 domain-containing protein [Anaerolineaceae bacterium]